jgi:hypothetical protein
LNFGPQIYIHNEKDYKHIDDNIKSSGASLMTPELLFIERQIDQHS